MSSATTLDDATGMTPRQDRTWLHRYTLLLVGLTFLLIIAGGNVTSKSAGLAVPDWPLSFGSPNPAGWTHMPLVRDEHGHRLIGATVGLVTIGLLIWLRLAEPRAWVRRMGYVALAGVIIQGVMGGLRVTEKSLILAIVHGCFAHAFFCLTIAIAMATSPRFGGGAVLADGDAARNRALRTWTTALVACVFGQLILGALLRHLGGGHAAVTHVVGALAVGATLIMAAQHVFSRPESEGPLAGRVVGLILLYGLQLVLGVVAYLLVNPLAERNAVTFMQVYLPTLHVAVGAIILGLSFSIAFKAYCLTGAKPALAASVEGVPA
jgi:heme a synthase